LSTHPMISVVDDDESIRAALDDLLQSLGYAVCTFASAEDFLHSSCPAEAACVISDVNMPQMSGPELFAILRSRGNPVPFIFITAFPDEGISKQVLHAGAACFLTKPFKKDALVEGIEAAVKRR
jgi:FixJ family two-component response regulator